MAVAALLALGMLAIIPGMIAGSVLTKSAKQVPNVEVPNVVTQVAGAICAYHSGWLSDPIRFGGCMVAATLPAGYAVGRVFNMARDQVREGRLLIQGTTNAEIFSIGMSLIRTGATLMRFTPVGFVAYTL